MTSTIPGCAPPATVAVKAGTGLLLYVVFFAIAAYVLYFVLRKAIAHGLRDARRAQERELQSPEPRR